MRPAPAKKAPVMLTDAQAKVFIDAVRDDSLYPLWWTLLATGMRKGEILGLWWGAAIPNFKVMAGKIRYTRRRQRAASVGVWFRAIGRGGFRVDRD